MLISMVIIAVLYLLLMVPSGRAAPIDSALKWYRGRTVLDLRRGKVVPARVDISLRFRRSPSEGELKDIEAIGVQFFRRRGKVLHVGRVYGARVSWDALDDVARHPLVERIESGRRVKVVPLLDISGPQVGARTAWDMGGRPRSLTGKGVKVALFDTGVDLYHPAFWMAGEAVEWYDMDGDRVLTPGVDGVDLDRDGRIGPGEVLRLWKAGVQDLYARYTPSPGFDPETDWLYVDVDGDSIRDAGPDEGFSVEDPVFGEPTFVPDDQDGDGALEVGEHLRRLDVPKVLAFLDKDPQGGLVEREGPDLIHDPGDPENHGTPAAGILVGGFPGNRRWVGIAPGAELLVVHRRDTTPEQYIPWAVDMGADIMVYEFGGWVFEFLDGSSNLEQMIDELAKEGIVQIAATGNLAGPKRKKHCRVEVTGEGVSIRVRVPKGYGIETVYITFLWTSPDSLTVEARTPHGLSFDLVPDGEVRELEGMEVFGNFEVSPRGTSKLDIALKKGEGLETGIWTLRLGSAGMPFRVDGYVADDVTGWVGGAQFVDFVADDGTVTWPGTADEAITVAAYDPSGLRNPEGEINDFSGRGLRIDGRMVVDIAAPGSIVFSTWTKEALGSPGGYGPFEGTSSALPHVAGAAAILLQAVPSLGHKGVKEALCLGAERDEHTGEVPNDIWGWGKLDIPGALKAVGFSGNLPPLFRDVSARWTGDGWEVEAEVEDADGISSVWLHFESSGRVPMAWEGGNLYGAEVDVMDTIWCYITASDRKGAKGFWPAGAPFRKRRLCPPALQEIGQMMGAFCEMLVPGDINGDLLPDLFTCGSLYRNLGQWKLENVLHISRFISSVSWGDYDEDGDPDLYVGSWNRGFLYRNIEGNFEEMAGESGIDTPSGYAAWVDYDGDGSLDLCVAGSSGVLLYRNVGDGKFEEAEHIGMKGLISSISWGDCDGDGDLDLYVGRYGYNSLLYKNVGGNFEEVGKEVGIDVWNGQNAAWVDYDGDGDFDLYVMCPYAPNFLYRNRGDGTFEEVASEVGAELPGYATWIDYDLDGDIDIFGISGRKLLRNEGGKFLRVWNPENLLYGASFADWDGDTAPELLLVEEHRRPSGRIYRAPLRGNCVALRIWKASGARVRLSSGSKVQIRQVVADDGLPLYFGIGEAREADWVEVTWPDGTTQVWGNLRAGRAYILGPEGPLDAFVWPGDVDRNGTVDGGDIIALAEYWGLSGSKRPNPLSTWAGQAAKLWDPPGATYADADGDGRVGTGDLKVILKNWGRAFGTPVSEIGGKEVLSEAYKAASKIPHLEVKREILSALKPEMAELGVPGELDLYAFPNPFRGGTTFRVRAPFRGKGLLRLYDVLGRPVRTLRKGHWPPGEKFLYWDGRDEDGRPVASGVYIVRLKVEDETRTLRVVLMK